MCVWSLSSVQLFAAPWTVTHQAPLSMGFPKQRYWSGLPFLSPGDLPDPEIKHASPALARGFFCCFLLLSHQGRPCPVMVLCYSFLLLRVSFGGGRSKGRESHQWFSFSVFFLQWLYVVPLHFLDRGGYLLWFEIHSLSAPSSVSVTKYGFFECFQGGGGVVMGLYFFFPSAFLVLENVKFPPLCFFIPHTTSEGLLPLAFCWPETLPSRLPSRTSGTFKSLSCSQCSDLTRILNIYGPPHCGNDYDLILESSFLFSLPWCFLGATVYMKLCKGLGVNLRNESIGN